MSPEPGQFTTAAVILLVILFVVARRVIGMVRGTPVNPVRLLASTALYVLLFALVVAEEFLLLPWYVPVVNVAVAGTVGALATPYVVRRVQVYRDAAGAWHYRLGYVIPALYVGLFGVRVLVDLFVLGVNPLSPSLPSGALSGGEAILLAAVDALFSVSMGLLLGRSFGVYRAYRAARAVAAHGASTPP